MAGVSALQDWTAGAGGGGGGVCRVGGASASERHTREFRDPWGTNPALRLNETAIGFCRSIAVPWSCATRRANV